LVSALYAAQGDACANETSRYGGPFIVTHPIDINVDINIDIAI